MVYFRNKKKKMMFDRIVGFLVILLQCCCFFSLYIKKMSSIVENTQPYEKIFRLCGTGTGRDGQPSSRLRAGFKHDENHKNVECGRHLEGFHDRTTTPSRMGHSNATVPVLRPVLRSA